MPFVNKRQVRACFAQNNPKWDCHKWAKKTKSIKKLPESFKAWLIHSAPELFENKKEKQ